MKSLILLFLFVFGFLSAHQPKEDKSLFMIEQVVASKQDEVMAELDDLRNTVAELRELRKTVRQLKREKAERMHQLRAQRLLQEREDN